MNELLLPGAMSREDIVELAVKHVCPARVATFRMLGTVPVMGRREGSYFWDMDGRKLFDAHINGGTFNLGHRNPEVIAALREALDHLDIGNHHFVSAARNRVAARLAELVPGDMRYCVFTPSGGEAIEVALRAARKVTGRRRIVSFSESYHGHGALGLTAGGYRDQAKYFNSDYPESDFTHVPFNDLAAMKAALEKGDTAAVICEMIPATSGFPMPAEGYYPAVRELCSRHGALLVADEVQTGLGRTGEFWACASYGIEPDVLITGKGLSGGIYPIAAAVMSAPAGAWLEEEGWGYTSTFGGSELGCAVADTVLDIVGRPGVIENVRAMSDVLGGGLEEIKKRHPFLVEIRRKGLVIGLRFDHPQGGALMTACGFASGLWAFPAGFDRSVLQFKLNLLVDRAACGEALALLDESIGVCEKLFLEKTK